MDKCIDFDRVADLYDLHVDAKYDLGFWKREVLAAGGRALEMMCGTGRIGLPLVRAGCQYCGVDYSAGLLDRFRHKSEEAGLRAQLIHADVRELRLGSRFAIVFIGFHSLSEVLADEDKLMARDGRMAGYDELERLALDWGVPLISTTELVEHL